MALLSQNMKNHAHLQSCVDFSVFGVHKSNKDTYFDMAPIDLADTGSLAQSLGYIRPTITSA